MIPVTFLPTLPRGTTIQLSKKQTVSFQVNRDNRFTYCTILYHCRVRTYWSNEKLNQLNEEKLSFPVTRDRTLSCTLYSWTSTTVGRASYQPYICRTTRWLIVSTYITCTFNDIAANEYERIRVRRYRHKPDHSNVLPRAFNWEVLLLSAFHCISMEKKN